MNKNAVFMDTVGSMQADTDRFYEKAAFGAIHFDGAGQAAAIDTAIAILEDAQCRCTDELMHTAEVESACHYLASRSDKAAPLTTRFWTALAEVEPHIRFEATAQLLRVIRQQFGA